MLRLSKGTIWAGVISGGLAQIKATSAYSNGQLNSNEYAVHTTKNVTGALGLMAGLEYGAMLGSMVFPGVGTILGTIGGAILGDRLGSSVGVQVGNALFNGNSQDLKQIPQNAQTQLMK